MPADDVHDWLLQSPVWVGRPEVLYPVTAFNSAETTQLGDGRGTGGEWGTRRTPADFGQKEKGQEVVEGNCR